MRKTLTMRLKNPTRQRPATGTEGTDSDEDKDYKDYTTFWETRPTATRDRFHPGMTCCTPV